MHMKTIIRTAASLLISCSVLASNVSAARVTALQNTNLYKKASSNSTILTAMPKGTTVNTISLSNSKKWVKLSLKGHVGYVKLSALNRLDETYDLQTNYPSTGYTNKSGLPYGATISTSGCGPTSVGNVLRNLCWISDATTKNVCKLATKSGARYNGGTDVGALLKAAKKKWGGFTYKRCTSYSDMKKHIKNGGMAVAHTPGSYGGASSLFSNGGHFVAIVGNSGDNLIAVDPYYTDNKWNASFRRRNASTTSVKGKVIVRNNAVAGACDYYYLVSKS